MALNPRQADHQDAKKVAAKKKKAAQKRRSPTVPRSPAAQRNTRLPSGLVMPVQGGRYSNDWGGPRSGGRGHEGTDIFAPRGTPIQAMQSGRVVKGFSNAYGGNVVRIQGDDGFYYYYAHLGSIANLKVGQRVSAGQVIGTVGTTGNARGTPPHLHLGVYQGAGGAAINPYPILQGSRPAEVRGEIPRGGGGPGEQSQDLDREALRQRYGYAAAFYESDPELRRLVNRAVAGGWTPDEFQARLRNTGWFRKHSSAQRTWIALTTGDPAEANARRKDKQADVGSLARQLGVPIAGDRIRSLAEAALRFGWDEEAVRRAVAAEFRYRPGKAAGGLAGQTIQSLQEQARSYLVPLSSKTIGAWTEKVLTGDADPESFTQYLQKQASTLFPELAQDIKRGVTVEEYLDPYRQSAAQLLEIAPEQVDFMAPRWSQAAFQVDPKTQQRRIMGLAEWQQELRSNSAYGWDKTQNARQGAAQFAETLLATFGARG